MVYEAMREFSSRTFKPIYEDCHKSPTCCSKTFLGATTSTAVVEGIIRYLKDSGCNNISIMESSWVGDNTLKAFKVCGYDDLSRKYDVPLIDLKSYSSRSFTSNGRSLAICSTPLEADFLINVPVLKAHCQTSLTCALKNNEGRARQRKRRFHALVFMTLLFSTPLSRGNW